MRLILTRYQVIVISNNGSSIVIIGVLLIIIIIKDKGKEYKRPLDLELDSFSLLLDLD